MASPPHNAERRADALVVLAHEMDADGIPDNETKQRLDAAAQAYRDEQAPLILLMGWAYRSDSERTLSETMAEYLCTTHGIDRTHLLLDRNSRDTVGDAWFSKRDFAKPRGWQRIGVITSAWHAARARIIFDFIYAQTAEIAIHPVNTPPIRGAEQEQASLQAFRETFKGITAGDDDAVWQRICRAHPHYNGKTYTPIDP